MDPALYGGDPNTTMLVHRLRDDFEIKPPQPAERADWVDFALDHNFRLSAARYREEGADAKGQEPGMESLLPSDLKVALRPYRELTEPGSLFIAELYCLPASRGQGLGSRFLDHAKETAASQGLSRVSLRVFSENVGAVRLYKRFGFEPQKMQTIELNVPTDRLSGSLRPAQRAS